MNRACFACALLILLAACGRPRPSDVVVQDVKVPDPGTVQFVAVGDTGHGNANEDAVARAMATVCAQHGGCSLALMLGDNIYPDGIRSADDSQMVTKFEKPFAADPFPFYAALGNHDYGLGWEFWRAEAQVDFGAHDSKFRMPARHYSFSAGPVDFFAIDTNAIFWGVSAGERQAIETERARSHRAWRIAFGHHPYLSNGRHGNAGHYDRVPFSWMPASGGDLESFFKDEICGKFDVYLCGHDHTLQDVGERCGTQFLIAGAGSETTSLGHRNSELFQASTPGFVYLEATNRQLSITYFDLHGRELHHRVVAK